MHIRYGLFLHVEQNKSSSVVEFLEPSYNRNLIVPLILQILFNNSALLIGEDILQKKFVTKEGALDYDKSACWVQVNENR